MARRLVTNVAALIAITSMYACGSDDGTEPSEATATSIATPDGTESPTRAASPTPTPRTPGNGSNTNGNGGENDDEFTYMPWGPDDPPIPSQYAVLAAAQGQPPRCDDLADTKPAGEFWETALAVCRALAEGADWPTTTTVPAPPPAANAYVQCLNTELSEMLGRALSWHAANPGRQPRVDYPSTSRTSPCQARIFDVHVLSRDDLDLDARPAVVPVAIVGSAMDRDPLSVKVDGTQVELTHAFHVVDPGDGLTTIVVLAPLAGQPRTAKIEVSTHRGLVEATVDLPGTGSSPSPTDDVTAPSTEPPATDPPATDPPPTDPPVTESQPTRAPDE